MAEPKIVLKGVDNTVAWANRYTRGLNRLRASKAILFVSLPYGWGIHFGRHRKSGKLARRAGGAFYLTRAVEQMKAGAVADISQGLDKVSAPGPWILRRLGRWSRRIARTLVPRGGAKRSRFKYRLRSSIRVEVTGRGA